MEIIDQLIRPPSANHIMLLQYILTVALVLFIPYLCMILGASSVSLYFNYRGNKTKDSAARSLYLRFAKDVIERLTITKNAEIALGVIPVLSILFSYAQLLYGAKTITIAIMALSAAVFIAAFVLIYRYRASFRIESVLTAFRSMLPSSSKPGEEVSDFEESVKSTKNSSGKVGVLLLYTAAYLFAGSTGLASDPFRWSQINNLLALFFSWMTLSNFLYLLLGAGIITGGAILFYFFKWTPKPLEMDAGYARFVKRFAGSLAFISAILLPLLLYYNFIYLPEAALSSSVFFYLLLAITVIFLLCNFLYWIIKNQEVTFVNPVFILIFLAFLFNIIKDQIAFGNALKEQTKFITEKAEEMEKEKKGKLISTEGLSGEEIYRNRCTSCHKFDSRLVGPPHDQVVPKYAGDVNKLMAFILNPVKVDPNFPPMPNPGLKTKEAAAVAKYLIDKVKKDTGK